MLTDIAIPSEPLHCLIFSASDQRCKGILLYVFNLTITKYKSIGLSPAFGRVTSGHGKGQNGVEEAAQGLHQVHLSSHHSSAAHQASDSAHAPKVSVSFISKV